LKRVGVFGGTFDPIHFGHLRTALELKESLKLDEVRMIPCHRPPHRASPGASAAQRLDMLQLALIDCDGFKADDRELQRTNLSYTLETLESLRCEEPESLWVLFVGVDAFSDFTSWHRWADILTLCDLAVATRPQAMLSVTAQNLLDKYQVSHLPEVVGSCGHIVVRELTQLDISSTHIRNLLRKGADPRFLLPAVVYDYLLQHKLYQDVL
jgi:nicotinate-nucleotide adenylyltransferase